jgi:hypothetical protein
MTTSPQAQPTPGTVAGCYLRDGECDRPDGLCQPGSRDRSVWSIKLGLTALGSTGDRLLRDHRITVSPFA